MPTTRFKGETAGERLDKSSISDSDMIQLRHKPGTIDDADKGISKAQLLSCPFGVSDTAAATAAKAADLTNSNPDFTLVSGREVVVCFTTANTASNPTLNFAGSGAIPLYLPNGAAVSNWPADTWMHLKYFHVTVENTQVQRWIVLSGLPVDVVTSGDKSPVTSGAVHAYVSDTVAAAVEVLDVAINASDHNIPRWINGVLGKDITSYYNDGTLWKRLNGTDGFSMFEDIYAGDYFQMSRAITAPNQDSQYATTGSQWVTIAGINTLGGNGDNISMDYNHLVMVPGKGETGSFHFGRKRMNSTNTTVGGYVASEMYTATLGAVVSAGSTASGATINQQLYAEFGSHLKTTRELLTSSMGASLTNRLGSAGGASNNWGWYNCQACLMSEVEVYGSIVWSSSGFDTGTACKQLPLFTFSKKAINNRSAYYWLKDIASSAHFCFVGNLGYADYRGASYTHFCVRPRFVLGA